MNPLIDYFKKYRSLDSDTENKLNAIIKIIIKQKGDYFLKQGQVVSGIGIIQSGSARAYYIKDDIEICTWFSFENDIITSTLPLSFNQPSLENIQFLELSVIYFIPKDDLNELYAHSPIMNIIGRKFAEEYCKVLEERINSLQTESAEQRYKSLVNKQPQLLQRVALGYIASYLGITQETLSRIRKKVQF